MAIYECSATVFKEVEAATPQEAHRAMTKWLEEQGIDNFEGLTAVSDLMWAREAVR